MLFNSLNTGSTDLRDTEVQQPNTAATLSLVISSRAFSANSGQLDAGSTTTASSFLPSRPPFLFCSSISISITSFNVVSLIAMVPDSECRMPILIVSCARAVPAVPPSNVVTAAAAKPTPRSQLRTDSFILVPQLRVADPCRREPLQPNDTFLQSSCQRDRTVNRA